MRRRIMNDTLNKVIIFAVGAAIGSAVTWKIVKTKYEQIANEEIESVKERFRNKKISVAEPEDEEPKDETENGSEDINKESVEYNKILDENGYRNYSSLNESEKEEKKDMGEPYVISPDEFDTEDYETESLTYYADGVLTDMYDNIIEDIEGMVGEDSLNHFGEYEDDSVFVRNDATRTDYEILLDSDNYYDKYPEERQQ